MRLNSPCDWIVERLRTCRPFFAVRINDGEMTCMQRMRSDGEVIGTYANPAPTNYLLGDEYCRMVEQMRGRADVLLGCSSGTPRADAMADRFAEQFNLDEYQLCAEHWPLDGVVDGSTLRLLRELRDRGAVLVTCKELEDAGLCLGANVILCPTADSWTARQEVEVTCRAYGGAVFVWAGGVGLKPTAWRIFQEHPLSSHIDVGHLFNGALGLRDYGWLQRGDGPWYVPYFDSFAPYVRGFLP